MLLSCNCMAAIPSAPVTKGYGPFGPGAPFICTLTLISRPANGIPKLSTRTRTSCGRSVNPLELTVTVWFPPEMYVIVDGFGAASVELEQLVAAAVMASAIHDNVARRAQGALWRARRMNPPGDAGVLGQEQGLALAISVIAKSFAEAGQ
jgi:hypothetical protein